MASSESLLTRKTKISLSADCQPKLDSLLDKLRKGMSELTVKGDDFTKQMWNMYNTLDELVISSKMNDKPNAGVGAARRPKPATDRENPANDSKAANNSERHTPVMTEQAVRQLSPLGLTTGRRNESLTTTTSGFSSPLASDSELQSNNDNDETDKTLTRTRKKWSNSSLDRIDSGSHTDTKCISLVDKYDSDGYVITKSRDKQTKSDQNRAPVNRVLDTIGALTSCSDSSDECSDINRKCGRDRHHHYHHQRRLLAKGRHGRPKSSNHYHSGSDADSLSGHNSLESGYKSDYLGSGAAVNITAFDRNCRSTVSETIDEFVKPAVDLRASGHWGSGSLRKVNIGFEDHKAFDRNRTLVVHRLDNHNHNNNNYNKSDEILSKRIPSPMNGVTVGANPVKSSSNRKSVGMFSEKMANRAKSHNSDAQLDHLLKLRRSVIKALKRCEEISSSSATSRDASPAISSRSSSPASTVVRSPMMAGAVNACHAYRRPRDESVSSCGSDKVRPRPVVSSPMALLSRDRHSLSPNISPRIRSLPPEPESFAMVGANNGNTKCLSYDSSVRISPISSLRSRRPCVNNNYGAYYGTSKHIKADQFGG